METVNQLSKKELVTLRTALNLTRKLLKYRDIYHQQNDIKLLAEAAFIVSKLRIEANLRWEKRVEA